MAIDLKKRLKGTFDGESQGKTGKKVSEMRDRGGKLYVEGAGKVGDKIGGEPLGEVARNVNQTQVDIVGKRPKLIK